MKRVLVVDDNADSLAFLSADLIAHGYDVESARQGAEALVKARRHPPALLISELLMPVMDGFTLLHHCKEDPRLRRVPFILRADTQTEQEDERLALELGADAFIAKSVALAVLLARLRQLEESEAAGRPRLGASDAQARQREALVRKLEAKTQEVLEKNRALERELGERRVAQDALERSEREHQQLSRHLEQQRSLLAEAQAVARLGSWETLLSTMAVHWSLETHSIFETDPARFAPTHQAFLSLVHPDDRAAVDAAFVGSFQTGTERSREQPLAHLIEHWIEHRVLLPGGSAKVLHERWRVFFDAAGAPVRAVGTCQDITERKRAEVTLRESEERFRQLAENINQVFWIADFAEGPRLYVSPAWQTIWGRPEAALYGAPELWSDTVHPEDREEVVRARARQAQGGYDETFRIVRPDGSVRWVHDRAFPVRDHAGAVYRIVGTVEDITERRRLETQFLRAQRIESLGTLAGGIAHDLNNVLTPILMSVELLKADERDGERLDILGSIESSAKKGAAMVRQVSSFGRGVEGRRVSVPLPRLLAEIEQIANHTFLKSIWVKTVIAPGLVPLAGDPTQLHQVILNLCVNARDAMPAGGELTLTAETTTLDAQYAGNEPEAKPGRYVLVTVRDTGTGMSPAVLDRLFEPFFTTKPHGKGAGLGLSTSQAIVKSHGGFLRVQSTPGAGTTVAVYLPAPPGVEEGAAPEQAAALPRGHGELVLVVDDEPPIREVTRRTLEAFGYRVLLAADGAEASALYAAQRQSICAALVDMVMPVMDGPATVQVLRKLNPRARIICVSGLAEHTEAPAATGTGPTLFLFKPFTTEALLRTLEQTLRAPG